MNIENKCVFPVVSLETQNTYQYDKNASELDSRIQPLTLSDLKSLRSEGYVIPNNANEGRVLALHPFSPKTLIDVEGDQFEIITKKMLQVGEILNYLGAKETTLKAHLESVEERTYDVKGKLTVTVSSLRAKFRKLWKGKSDKRLEIVIGNNKEWNQECYKRAIELSKEYGLDTDTCISSMISQRDPLRPINKFHLTINISNELNEIMDISGSLNIASKGFKLDGSFKSKHDFRYEYVIDQEIIFI